ncbi:hypothetical protein LTR04_003469, partial [Oleoguttula sp. CCFEE 6159]
MAKTGSAGLTSGLFTFFHTSIIERLKAVYARVSERFAILEQLQQARKHKRTSILVVQTSANMSVELDPVELGFQRPFTHEVSQTLRLRNPNSDPVAFKVKTTAPK